jgi:hypothetical protein
MTLITKWVVVDEPGGSPVGTPRFVEAVAKQDLPKYQKAGYKDAVVEKRQVLTG